jgi:hypothetical protein
LREVDQRIEQAELGKSVRIDREARYRTGARVHCIRGDPGIDDRFAGGLVYPARLDHVLAGLPQGPTLASLTS